MNIQQWLEKLRKLIEQALTPSPKPTPVRVPTPVRRVRKR
ncbi:hypothetical protein ARMA_0996 [Ardenticatena maritima]|uniref:Uncharacterized protein n=1 Tax=Ardenticatena maritima TaxID=872965 RepID=A0A0M8K652_9CHLR|nr:hypothetical protein ARMA_0996 [Ardenticatena maritima]